MGFKDAIAKEIAVLTNIFEITNNEDGVSFKAASVL